MTESTRTTALHHDALFYDDDRTLASTAVSFIREGLELGETVYVSFNQHSLLPLLNAVFAGETGVVYTERDRSSRPARLLDQCQRCMDEGLRQGVPGFRNIGYVDLEGSDLHWAEWLRYEAAVETLRAYPLRALCVWDTRRISRQQAAAFRSVHPGLVGADGPQPNQAYDDPVQLVRRHLPEPDPAQGGPADYDAEVGEDLRQLGVEIYPLALRSELPGVKVDDFIKAVGAVVVNAHSHGKQPVRLRLWAQPQKLVCTVTDQGPGIEDPFVGYAKPLPRRPGQAGDTGGLGLWAARQLCDTLDYANDPSGFTVRLVTRG